MNVNFCLTNESADSQDNDLLNFSESVQSLFYQYKHVWNSDGILAFLMLLTGILLFHIHTFFLFQLFLSYHNLVRIFYDGIIVIRNGKIV